MDAPVNLEGLAGRSLLHYLVQEKIGCGGMGVVYEAVDTRLGRKVALKFLPPELAENRDALRRFRREAQAASALNHPNICTIYSIEEQDSLSFIAMELLEGDVLRSRIPPGGLPLEEALTFGIQIADALDASHAMKILHRDIKTENIFVTRRNNAKILDFGIAKLESETAAALERTGARTTAGDLTRPGGVVGTVAYMSPEHARGENLDARSDLFSLGAVLYEMATGRRAFPGSTPGIVYSAILSQDPVRPIAVRPDLPPELEQIILKLLRKEPQKRYPSAAALRDDLMRLKLQIDSGTFTKSGNHLRIAGDLPQSTIAESPVGGTYQTLLKQQTYRKNLLIGLAAGIVVAFAGLFSYFLSIPEYYNFIAIGDFGAQPSGSIPDIFRFVLERGLAQDPDLRLVRMTEFANAVKSGNPDKGRGQALAFLLRWLPFLGRPDPEPLLMISGSIDERPGVLELQLRLRDRGYTETLSFPLRGGNGLLSEGMDRVIDRVTQRFKKASGSPAYKGIASVRRVSEILTKNWDAMRCCWRGMVAFDRLDIATAEREFMGALTIDPSFALAHLQLGKTLAWQRRAEEGRRHLEIARGDRQHTTYIDQEEIKYLLARIAGKSSEERLCLQSLVWLQPYHQEYLFELAESYFNTADTAEAIDNYRKALALGELPLAYNHMGYCLAWEGNHAASEEALKRYLALDGTANAYDSLGDAYISSGKYHPALEMKEMALRKDEGIFYARRGRAVVDVLLGRHKSAEMKLREYYVSGISDAEKASCQALLAFLCYRMRNPEQALEAYKVGLMHLQSGSLDLPKDELTWIKGLIEMQRGNLAGVRESLSQMSAAIKTRGYDATNYNPWYKFYLDLSMQLSAAEGNSQDALKSIHDLEFIKEKLGYWVTMYDRAFFLDSIGKTYEKIGRLNEAEKAYHEALDYNPHFALALLHLAQLQWDLGQAEQARKTLESFFLEWKDADPDSPDYIAAKNLRADL